MNFLGHQSPKWAEWECLRIDACGPQAWQLLLINAFGEPLLLCQTDDGDMTLIVPPLSHMCSPSLLFLLLFHSRSCRYFCVTSVHGKGGRGGAPIRGREEATSWSGNVKILIELFVFNTHMLVLSIHCRAACVPNSFVQKKFVQCELQQHRCCWIELGLNLIYKCFLLYLFFSHSPSKRQVSVFHSMRPTLVNLLAVQVILILSALFSILFLNLFILLVRAQLKCHEAGVFEWRILSFFVSSEQEVARSITWLRCQYRGHTVHNFSTFNFWCNNAD